MPTKYTAIWQTENPHNRDWIEEIFGPYLSGHVTDGRRERVLDDAILIDDFVYARDISYYAKFRGKNAFLIHFQDEFYEVGSKVYENFRGVFRAFWSGAFRSKFLMILPVGYNRGMRRSVAPKAALERTYLWTFVGGIDKGSRPGMARALSRVEPHFLFATDQVPGVVMLNSLPDRKKRAFTPKECESFLQESVFAPSPMGNANLECYRVYEALEAGAIPIVERRLTLDYYRRLLGKHPMITVGSWSQARNFLRDIVKKPEQLNAIQNECLQWWTKYKAEFTLKVGEFLAERSTSAEQATGPFLTAWGRSPLWQPAELLRHHDSGALMKRIQKQLTRLVMERKFRVAYSNRRPT